MPPVALRALGYETTNDCNHALQTLDLYYDHLPDQKTFWIVFIHGGAWRDPNNDSIDGKHLLEALPVMYKTNAGEDLMLAGASLNYRLSPEVTHPCHVDDVLAGLSMLAARFEMTRFALVGHSAGATLAFQAYARLLNSKNIHHLSL